MAKVVCSCGWYVMHRLGVECWFQWINHSIEAKDGIHQGAFEEEEQD